MLARAWRKAYTCALLVGIYYKMMWLLWKTEWQFFKIVKIELP